MSRDSAVTRKQLSAVFLPLIVFVMQLFPPFFAYILIMLLLPITFLLKNRRKELLLLLFMPCGFLAWLYTSDKIKALILLSSLSSAWASVFSRFSLIGYLLLFFLWDVIDKTNTNYFAVGDFYADIKLPFIWYGKKDNVLRYATIFSLLCIVAAGIFRYFNGLKNSLVQFGIAFSIINSVLEEFLWRGFILNRTNALYGEKVGLIVMSLAFGLYHYSLGFGIPICLLFSLGGVYFGGVALCSKGLLLPVIMHMSMNLLFVELGIICF